MSSCWIKPVITWCAKIRVRDCFIVSEFINNSLISSYFLLFQNKRATKNLTPFFTEPEKFFLKPIIDAQLNAESTSIMITPTSSPTKQLDWNNSISCPGEKQNSTQNKKLVDLTLVNEKSTDKSLFRIDCISELDINSIEEDDV